MSKWRKKPVIIDAVQWFKNGDHVEDKSMELLKIGEANPEGGLSEGKIVRYFRHPRNPGHTYCKKCKHTMHFHGWIDTLEGGHIVCPGDWIIKGIQNEFYPCKNEIFQKTYEKVDVEDDVNNLFRVPEYHKQYKTKMFGILAFWLILKVVILIGIGVGGYYGYVRLH